MNDSGLLKELIEKFNGQLSLLITIAVFVFINIIVGIFNYIGQRKLKKMETNVHVNNIREGKRLDLMHDLYKKMDKVRSIFNDPIALDLALKDMLYFLNENEVYFKNSELDLAKQFFDYSSTILVSPINKDLIKEKDILSKYKLEFNK